jgi:hypothetical protein
MPASSSMNAMDVGRGYGRSLVIAVCFVPTVQCPVRRSSPSYRARKAWLPAVPSKGTCSDTSQTSRDWLANKAQEYVGVVCSLSAPSCGPARAGRCPDRFLDRRADLNGHR